MRLFLALIFLPLGYFVSNTRLPVITTEDYIYELTVKSPGQHSVPFNLIISGFTLSPDGTRMPFKFEKENLTTPYQIKLNNGKYTATINGKAAGDILLSKVQGIENGKEMGYASGSSQTTILDFGFGGNYSVKSE